MNRFALIPGSLPPNAKQNIKQAAFLEYLKSFASNGLETLEKLEYQFNQNRTSTHQTDNMKTFEKIKNLIACYELFVLEINDSCEFIEAPEFGTCLLKVFIQLIAILKWALQQLLVEKQLNTEAFIAANSTFTDSLQVNQKAGPSFQSFNPSRSRQEQKTISNTFNDKISLDTPKDDICQECFKKLTPNMYQIKEQATIQLKDINEEISSISKEYTEEEKNARKQNGERNQLQKFIQRRDVEAKLLLEYGLGENSRNQQILTEILYNLTMKGEAIQKFADLRMSSIVDLGKFQSVSQEDYKTLKTGASADLNQRMVSAKHKLALIFKQHTNQYEKLKKSQLIDTGVQIDEGDSIKMQKLNNQKTVKKLKAQIRRLEKELECQKNLNEQMQKFLASKSSKHEAEVFRYKNERLSFEMKSKNDAINTPKLDESSFDKRPEKSLFYSPKNSQLSILQEKQEDNLGNINENMNESFSSSSSKNLARNSFIKSGKKIPKPKRTFKFQKLSDNSKQSELQLISLVVNQKILANVKAPNQAQVQMRPNECFERKYEKKVASSSCAVQTAGYPLQKSSTIHEEGYLTKSQHKSKAMHVPRTPNKSLHMYRKVRPTKYVKKPSMHQNQEGTTIHTAVNKQLKKQKQNEEFSLLNCAVLQSKSSKFLQRTVKFNTIRQLEPRNEFIPLNLTDVQKNRDYKKKYSSGTELNCKKKSATIDKKPYPNRENNAHTIQENSSHKIIFHSLTANKI